MDLVKMLRNRREAILAAAQRHKARNVRVFGSVARGQATPSSDIDLLVEMAPDASLFDLIALEQELQRVVGHRVQVVSEGGLKPRIRDRVLSEAVAV